MHSSLPAWRAPPRALRKDIRSSGHGSERGDPARSTATILNWDGKVISGTINPGTDDIPIKNASLNPEGWVVHLEGDAKDKTGPINYVFDGKIEGLAFHNRSITGTWKSQRESGQFKIQRQ